MRADLALIGFGRVGRRLAMLLRERRDWLLREYDLECRIVGIATRRHGVTSSIGGVDVDTASRRSVAGLRLDDTHEGTSSSDVIRSLGESDAPIRAVVEPTTLSIEDGEPAIAHIDAAFDAGCHAVTANKGPVAFAYRRLADRAAAAGLSFLFEGVVMDGVPVFNLVRETMPAVHVHGFRGVINSTTNYILSALEDGQPFGPALAAMQEAGIAEADPELDLEGWDAAAKTAALANVLMGADLNPHKVDRIGIGPGSAEPASAARVRGNRLRLVASATRTPSGAVSARVAPLELPGDDLLAGLRHAANALVLHTDVLGDVAIHQLGGGLTMTAYAILSDLVTIRRRTDAERVSAR